ncbi:hypothetical protein BV25DRAFT_1916388 [Artomyces pyxidatus]|uniref:Uncharacterized protein n=1 Tax=Artomyces pyxidatus TaxID=48021 RepID=A0ACB8T0U3_9AGAM|nr:hypothetical protein BV25DRAFT_1916388 [Artomyces pyxidatus]
MPGRGAPRSGRVLFTEDDDALLMKYIATYNPDLHGRLGSNLYRALADNADGKWPWAERHSWQSWRERYKNRQESFNAKILAWQKKKGTQSAPPAKPAKSVSRKSTAARPSAQRQAKAPHPEERDERVKQLQATANKRRRDSAGANDEQVRVKKVKLDPGGSARQFSVQANGRSGSRPAEEHETPVIGDTDYTGEVFDPESDDPKDAPGARAAVGEHDDSSRRGASNVTPKPIDGFSLHISQEPTPPRSGTSMTPHGGSPAHIPRISRSPSPPRTPPLFPAQSRTPLKPRRQPPVRKRPQDGDDDIFAIASPTQSPPTVSRRPRAPPQLQEGPFSSAYTDARGGSRFKQDGRRVSGVERDSSPDEDNRPPSRKRSGKEVDANSTKVAARSTTSQPATVASRLPARKQAGPSQSTIQRPVAPREGVQARHAPVRRPVQTNATASSSKVMLPPLTVVEKIDLPVEHVEVAPFHLQTESRLPDLPAQETPRPTSEAVFKIPPVPTAATAKPTTTPIDHVHAQPPVQQLVESSTSLPKKSKENTLDLRTRSKTVAGAQSVPHIDLRTIRSRSPSSAPTRSRRQSLPAPADHMTPETHASSASRTVSRRTSDANSAAPYAAWPVSRPPSRASTRASLSAGDRQLVADLGFEVVLNRMAENHGFHLNIVRHVVQNAHSLAQADERLRTMREGAQRELEKALQAESSAEEEDEDDEQETDGEEEPRARSHAPSLPPPPEGERSPERPQLSLRVGLQITPLPQDEGPPPHYSPVSPTRARAFRRLQLEGRVAEAKAREIRHASRGVLMRDGEEQDRRPSSPDKEQKKGPVRRESEAEHVESDESDSEGEHPSDERESPIQKPVVRGLDLQAQKAEMQTEVQAEELEIEEEIAKVDITEAKSELDLGFLAMDEDTAIGGLVLVHEGDVKSESSQPRGGHISSPRWSVSPPPVGMDAGGIAREPLFLEGSDDENMVDVYAEGYDADFAPSPVAGRRDMHWDDSDDEDAEEGDYLPSPVPRPAPQDHVDDEWGEAEINALLDGNEDELRRLEEQRGRGSVKRKTAELYSMALAVYDASQR